MCETGANWDIMSHKEIYRASADATRLRLTNKFSTHTVGMSIVSPTESNGQYETIEKSR